MRPPRTSNNCIVLRATGETVDITTGKLEEHKPSVVRLGWKIRTMFITTHCTISDISESTLEVKGDE
jgi:hypothetical protein